MKYHITGESRLSGERVVLSLPLSKTAAESILKRLKVSKTSAYIKYKKEPATVQLKIFSNEDSRFRESD